MTDKKLIGRIVHFYPKIGVAVAELESDLKIGERISIEKKDNKLEMIVQSMQMEHKQIDKAGKGQSVGIKVEGEVEEGSAVYKIAE